MKNFEILLLKLLNMAIHNNWILPAELEVNKSLIRTYGQLTAEAEFDRWFECQRQVNPFRLDRVELRYQRGEINAQERDRLSKTWCYEPLYTIPQHMRAEAHQKVNDALGQPAPRC